MSLPLFFDTLERAGEERGGGEGEAGKREESLFGRPLRGGVDGIGQNGMMFTRPHPTRGAHC